MEQDRQRRREPAQAVAVVVAALFVAAAVLDVGPGLLDNVVQLGFGIVGLALSRAARGARRVAVLWPGHARCSAARSWEICVRAPISSR